MNRKIDNNNRLVIPKEMYNALDLKSGDEVNIDLVDDKIIITNPNQEDKFENWLRDQILMTESSEAKQIFVKYQELKK